MKKFSFIVLMLMLVMTFAACRSKKPNETTIPTTSMPTQATTAPTTMPTTAPTTRPTTEPTIETNIPDPNVDTSMPDGNDSNPLNGTDATDNSAGNESRSRNSHARKY